MVLKKSHLCATIQFVFEHVNMGIDYQKWPSTAQIRVHYCYRYLYTDTCTLLLLLLLLSPRRPALVAAGGGALRWRGRSPTSGARNGW